MAMKECNQHVCIPTSIIELPEPRFVDDVEVGRYEGSLDLLPLHRDRLTSFLVRTSFSRSEPK